MWIQRCPKFASASTHLMVLNTVLRNRKIKSHLFSLFRVRENFPSFCWLARGCCGANTTSTGHEIGTEKFGSDFGFDTRCYRHNVLVHMTFFFNWAKKKSFFQRNSSNTYIFELVIASNSNSKSGIQILTPNPAQNFASCRDPDPEYC